MKRYYLKDESGYIIAKFELVDESWFTGSCYECVGWGGDNHSPFDWLYHSGITSKSDSCSHWYFRGEDYTPETEDSEDSYYHLCGSGCFENHIRLMCFVWKLAMDFYINYNKTRGYDTKYPKEDYDTELIEFMLKGYEIIEEEESA